MELCLHYRAFAEECPLYSANGVLCMGSLKLTTSESLRRFQHCGQISAYACRENLVTYGDERGKLHRPIGPTKSII
jgi:hypothetical protein